MPKNPARRSRALIYARGTNDQIEAQVAAAYDVCRDHRYEVVSIVRDPPGGAQGYHDAHRMLRHDEADRIVVASSVVLPDVIESATGSLSGPRVRAILNREAPRRRRIRPIPRGDGEA